MQKNLKRSIHTLPARPRPPWFFQQKRLFNINASVQYCQWPILIGIYLGIDCVVVAWDEWESGSSGDRRVRSGDGTRREQSREETRQAQSRAEKRREQRTGETRAERRAEQNRQSSVRWTWWKREPEQLVRCALL